MLAAEDLQRDRSMRIISTLAVVALLQSGPPATESLQRDVAALAAADSNQARFDVLTAMLRDRGLPFAVEQFNIDKPVGGENRTEGRNVVVSVGAGAEHMIIGAHYDAIRLSDGSLSRGAVDNGASTVLLVHLADVLRSAKLPIRVEVVWFDMEELGLRGSAAYAERHASPAARAMLNLDINAYGDTILFGPSADSTNAALRRVLLTTCAAEEFDCVAFPQMPPGDDRTFTRRGVPTLSLATLPVVEAHQLWLMMNAGASSGLAKETVPSILRTLHTAEDTPAKVSGESMARTLRLVVALVRNLARRD
jgi:Zn-dependent M28 family amino/carboxypeptidase